MSMSAAVLGHKIFEKKDVSEWLRTTMQFPQVIQNGGDVHK